MISQRTPVIFASYFHFWFVKKFQNFLRQETFVPSARNFCAIGKKLLCHCEGTFVSCRGNFYLLPCSQQTSHGEIRGYIQILYFNAISILYRNTFFPLFLFPIPIIFRLSSSKKCCWKTFLARITEKKNICLQNLMPASNLYLLYIICKSIELQGVNKPSGSNY